MSPQEIRDVAASVKQRLLNLSRERGEDFNFRLTRYGVERLLYRLDQSKPAEEFVLKGAMLFHMGPDPLPHRPTRDVDLLGKGSPEPARLLEVFREVCAVKVVDDGLVFDERSVRGARIREEQDYEGVRMHLQARMGTASGHRGYLQSQEDAAVHRGARGTATASLSKAILRSTARLSLTWPTSATPSTRERYSLRPPAVSTGRCWRPSSRTSSGSWPRARPRKRSTFSTGG